MQGSIPDFTMLCITLPGLSNFKAGHLYLSTPFTYFAQAQLLPLADICKLGLCFVLFRFYI